jgi:hypothetical protein
MKRDWRAARAKVEAEGRCRVCGRSDLRLEAAHIVSRARVRPGAGEDPANIVPLCARDCHARYDRRALDLLPYLTRVEQAKAVELHPGGLLGAVERITGERFAPVNAGFLDRDPVSSVDESEPADAVTPTGSSTNRMRVD